MPSLPASDSVERRPQTRAIQKQIEAASTLSAKTEQPTPEHAEDETIREYDEERRNRCDQRLKDHERQ
jgi:hypothetical protein